MLAVLGSQAAGLLAMAVAGAVARSNHSSWAEAAFWLGMLAIAGPTAGRLVSAAPSRAERVILVTGLGIAAYLVKVMLWPVQFTFHDEFASWRTTADIIASHHLFAANPLTPVTASYPGSDIITAALSQLSRLPVFVSGLIVVGVARLVLMLAIYLVFERVSGSSRAAASATLLYAGNPNFLFFGAQFAYESVSIPLGAFLLYLALRPRPSGLRAALPGASALVLTAASLAVTHHLTSWLFAAGLVMAAAIAFAMRRSSVLPPSGLAVAAVALVALVGLWLAYVGVGAVSYVGPVLTGGGSEFLHLIEGESAARTLFVSAGQVSPLWEQVLAFASVGVILAGLPFALWMVWRRHRADPHLIFLGMVAAVYPASLALRLTSSTVETSARLSEYLFFGVAGVLGLLAVRVLTQDTSARWRYARHGACAAAITLVFGGGAIIAWGRWSRLPGPYLVSADDRSIEPQGETAARWMRSHLGRGNRIATDRTNALLMGSPLGGEQHPVNGQADGISVNDLILSTRLTEADLLTVARGRIRYLVIDDRLSHGLPLTGIYVDPPNWISATPVSPLAALKFGHARAFSRVFDSGDIDIYSVSPQLLP